jgi:dipeptidyl aminopeptidase/acylaminoacyl peptidase
MKTIITMLLLFISTTAQTEALPAEYFTKAAQFSSIKLSPDGLYFAATVPKENRTTLVIVDRKKMKPIQSFGFGKNEHIGKFSWASNTRLVYSKVYQKNDRETKTNKGELFAANVDGSDLLQVFGLSDTKSKLRSKRGIDFTAKIVHMLPNDVDHILIEAKKRGSDFDNPVKVFKININNKKRSLITITPLGNMKIVFNIKGEPVIASGKNRQGESVKYLYQGEAWLEMDKSNPLRKYTAISVNSDQSKLYLKKSVIKGGTSALYQYDFASKEISLLFNNPIVDIKSYIKEPGTGIIIGVKTMFDGINYHYIDKKNKFSKTHQSITQAFPGYDISITANTAEDNESVITIKSDKNPGEYYLYNRDKKTIDFLISKKPWINESKMASQKLIQYTARDGQTIYGYLTMPESTKPLPLIIDVHGGPFGKQDSWLFNSDAQFFANNGYAVLQINFRGSGGYGRSYEQSAYKKRSTLIQHDIIDGTRWAQQLELIDDTKVCIIGGSFGGYSALMSPLIEPLLYKCSISRYGPYDLVYQMKNADYMSKDSVSVGAKKKYGDNESHWHKASPLTYIDQLKTPLLIVTGGRDERVPPQSAWNLKAALDQRDISYQWLYKEKEGHGYKNPKNKLELYQKSLAFINLHLQPAN